MLSCFRQPKHVLNMEHELIIRPFLKDSVPDGGLFLYHVTYPHFHCKVKNVCQATLLNIAQTGLFISQVPQIPQYKLVQKVCLCCYGPLSFLTILKNEHKMNAG